MNETLTGPHAGLATMVTRYSCCIYIYIYILVHCNGPPTNSGSILNGMLANSCWNFNLIDLHDCQVDRSVERYATVCVMEPLC